MSTDPVLGVAGNCHFTVAPVGQWGHSCVRLKLRDLDVAWDESRSYRSGSQPLTVVGFSGDSREATPWGFIVIFPPSVSMFWCHKSGIGHHNPLGKKGFGVLGRCKDLALRDDLEPLKSQPGLEGDTGGSSFPPVLFPCSALCRSPLQKVLVALKHFKLILCKNTEKWLWTQSWNHPRRNGMIPWLSSRGRDPKTLLIPPPIHIFLYPRLLQPQVFNPDFIPFLARFIFWTIQIIYKPSIPLSWRFTPR